MAHNCDRPDTLVTIPLELPLCEDPILIDVPAIDAQFPRYPDVSPPPFCMCLPRNTKTGVTCGRCVTKPDEVEDEEYEEKWKTVVVGDDVSLDLSMVMVNSECCEPEFEFRLDAQFPCLPYAMDVSVEQDDDLETPSIAVTRVSKTEEEWVNEFIADEGRPPDPDAGEVFDPADGCKFEWDFKFPARAKLGVTMKHEGPGITYLNQCDPPGIQEGIKLTAEWTYDAVFKARVLEITTYIDLGIPLIGKLSYNDGTPETSIPIPPDSAAGVKTLGPPE